jgi:hypothetical protein
LVSTLDFWINWPGIKSRLCQTSFLIEDG